MKSNWKFMLPLLMIGLFSLSCEKDEDATSTDDNDLVVEIMTTTNLEAIEVTDLPVESQAYVDANYFDTYIEVAEQAANKGYRVELGTGEVLFFNTIGDVLEFDGEVTAFGRLGGIHPHGPCVRLLRRLRGHLGNHDTNGDGRPEGPFAFDVDSLSTTITDYITANYPDAVIRRAAFRDDNFLVLISRATVLVFDADGNFVEERNPLAHCRNRCNRIEAEELPTDVATYIDANLPGATFRRACQRDRGLVVFLTTEGDTRQILGFNNEGELVFSRP